MFEKEKDNKRKALVRGPFRFISDIFIMSSTSPEVKLRKRDL
jgi:hypothetical protein